jgi:hypothetical protein
MRIRFNCKPFSVDRRTPDLIAHGDSITEKLFAVRVSKNLKERKRLERQASAGRVYLIKQAG